MDFIMTSITDKEMNVSASYYIQSLSGEVLAEKSETLKTGPDYTKIVCLNLPKGIPAAGYIFVSEIKHSTGVVFASRNFNVKVKKPLLERVNAPFLVAGVLLVVLCLAAIKVLFSKRYYFRR